MSSTSFIGQETLPLGLKNNNVGNIRPNPNYTWLGQIGVNKGYVVFKDIEHGIRAMAKDLHTKITIDGLNEIAKYIPRYAPPTGNATQNYINAVSEYSGIPSNQILTADAPTLLKLVPAHIRVEVGAPDYKLITQDMINTGVAMAF